MVFPRQQAVLEVRQSGLECPNSQRLFEDFEQHVANTELLLIEMKLVLEATPASVREFAQAIDFPVAVDHHHRCSIATPENTEALTETILDFDRLPKSRASSTASKGERLLAANIAKKHQQPYTESFV